MGRQRTGEGVRATSDKEAQISDRLQRRDARLYVDRLRPLLAPELRVPLPLLGVELAALRLELQPAAGLQAAAAAVSDLCRRAGQAEPPAGPWAVGVWAAVRAEGLRLRVRQVRLSRSLALPPGSSSPSL
jgi:hypothetical protein